MHLKYSAIFGSIFTVIHSDYEIPLIVQGIRGKSLPIWRIDNWVWIGRIQIVCQSMVLISMIYQLGVAVGFSQFLPFFRSVHDKRCIVHLAVAMTSNIDNMREAKYLDIVNPQDQAIRINGHFLYFVAIIPLQPHCFSVIPVANQCYVCQRTAFSRCSIEPISHIVVDAFERQLAYVALAALRFFVMSPSIFTPHQIVF